MKKYSLSEAEKNNLGARQQLAREHNLIANALNNDTVGYIYSVVYKRLGIDPSKNYELSQDNSTLTIKEEDGSNKPK